MDVDPVRMRIAALIELSVPDHPVQVPVNGRAPQARRRGPEQHDRRRAEGRRQVRHPGVSAHHEIGLGHHLGQLLQ